MHRLKDIGFVVDPIKGPKWHSRKWTNKQIVAKQQQQLGEDGNETNTVGGDSMDIPVPPELILGDWDDMFEQLSDFKKEFGHVNIPTKEDKYKQLRGWVVRQRKLFAKLKNGENAPLTASQIAKLSEGRGPLAMILAPVLISTTPDYVSLKSLLLTYFSNDRSWS